MRGAFLSVPVRRLQLTLNDRPPRRRPMSIDTARALAVAGTTIRCLLSDREIRGVPQEEAPDARIDSRSMGVREGGRPATEDRDTRALVVAGLLGATAMYLLDPERGRRRRGRVRDKVVRLQHVSDEGAQATARDARNRSKGALARSQRMFRSSTTDDAVLVPRVRATIGRVVSHPHAIEVSARDGHVVLSGPILRREVEALLNATAHVRGVRSVENRLSEYAEAGNIPGLQGRAEPPGQRLDIAQRVWSPTTRLMASVAGSALVTSSLMRRTPLTGPAALLGAALLLRAGTNLEWKRLVGIGAGRRAIEVHKIMHVNAPVEDVYAFWANFEQFPRMMDHVREVRRAGDGSSHWTVAGPGRVPIRFDAVVTRQEPDRLLAWKTVPRAPVQHGGVVRLDPDVRSGTRMDVRMSYNPPGGALGHAIAMIFGSDPKRAMDEDFVRFKSLLEDGKTTAHGRPITRYELTANMHRD